MTHRKVPMQADGRGGPKVHADGVSDATIHGGRGGESAGDSYENPHTGKEARGRGGHFNGGQTEKEYYGKGQLGGKKADPDEPGRVGQGGRKASDR